MRPHRAVLPLLLAASAASAASRRLTSRELRAYAAPGGCTLGLLVGTAPGKVAANQTRPFQETSTWLCSNEEDEAVRLSMSLEQAAAVETLAAGGAIRYFSTRLALGEGVQALSNGDLGLAPGAPIVIHDAGVAGGERRGLTGNTMNDNHPTTENTNLHADYYQFPHSDAVTNRYTLVFRVTDKEWTVSRYVPIVLTDKFFGTYHNGGVAPDCTPQTILSECSLGHHRLIPGAKPPYNVEHLQSARGVIDIEMVKHQHGVGDVAQQYQYMKAAKRWLNHFLGDRGAVSDYIDHAIFIAPRGREYASIGGMYSVFTGRNIFNPGVVVAALAKNMMLGPSNRVNRDAYGEFNYINPPIMYEPAFRRETWRQVGPLEDNSGLLGGNEYDPWGTTQLGENYNQNRRNNFNRCFSPPKNWLLHKPPSATEPGEGWYHNDTFVEYSPADEGAAKTFKIIGLGDYKLQTDPRLPIVIRAKTIEMPARCITDYRRDAKACLELHILAEEENPEDDTEFFIAIRLAKLSCAITRDRADQLCRRYTENPDVEEVMLPHYLYVGLNAASGIATDTGSSGADPWSRPGIAAGTWASRNKVTVYAQVGEGYTPSWELAALDEYEQYDNSKGLHDYFRGKWAESPGDSAYGTHTIVEVKCLNTAVSPMVACVCLRTHSQKLCPDDCNCDAVVPAPTPPPTIRVEETRRPTSSPTACRKDVHLVVEIDTDKYGGETSWELQNSCDNVLIAVVEAEEYPNAGENLSGAQQRLVQRAIVPQEAHEVVTQKGGRNYKYEYCLDMAQFKFTIRDTFRDGLCCDHGQGGYRVTINGNEMASGGEFGKEEIRVFGSCTEPAPPHMTPRPPRLSPTAQPTREGGHLHVPGEEGVIKFEMYKTKFTYTPSKSSCYQLHAVTNEVPGNDPYACAWACSMLSSCGGFVDTVGGCFLAHKHPLESWSKHCNFGHASKVVYYNRQVTVEPVCKTPKGPSRIQ